MIYKPLCQGFELRLLISFLMMISTPSNYVEPPFVYLIIPYLHLGGVLAGNKWQQATLTCQPNYAKHHLSPCPISWDCRIHRLHLCRGVRHPFQWVSCYDTIQSDGEVPGTLELWRMWSTPSLPLLQVHSSPER